jgi:hypothetical protein
VDALEALRRSTAIPGHVDDKAAVVTVRIEDAGGAARPWRVSWLLPGQEGAGAEPTEVLKQAMGSITHALDELASRSQTNT